MPSAADYSDTLAMNAEPPPAVGSIEPLKVLASQISKSRSPAPQGTWAIVQLRIAAQTAATSTWRKKNRKAESEDDHCSSKPSASVRTAWQMAKRSRSRRLWQQLRIPSTATSSRYQAGMRIPRRIRASGIALRKLIRSRSNAGRAISGTGGARFRRPHPMLTASAGELMTHFESVLCNIQGRVPQAHHAGLMAQPQNLNAQTFQAIKVAAQEITDSAVVRLLIAMSTRKTKSS